MVIKIDGTSAVSINFAAVYELVSKLCASKDLADFTIKYDARTNVKSTFGKVQIPSNGKDAQITVYTGGIKVEWDNYFKSSDGIADEKQAVLFMTITLLKNYINGKQCDAKTSLFQQFSLSEEFVEIKEKFSQIYSLYEKFEEEHLTANPETQERPRQTRSSSSSSADKGKPIVPEKVGEVPTVQLPEGFKII